MNAALIILEDKTVLLHCWDCGVKKRTFRDPIDPPNITTIVFPCPKCRKDPWPRPIYLDGEGNEVPLS